MRLTYFEGKSVLSALSNFTSRLYSSGRKQNCSLPALRPSIQQCVGQDSQGRERGSRNAAPGAGSPGRQHAGTQIPRLQSQMSSDTGGKDTHLELSGAGKKSCRQRGEKGKVGKKVERTFLTHFAFFSICLCDVAVSY